MKAVTDFKSVNEYWAYIHTQCVLNVTCVLLTSRQWENYPEMVKEADNIAFATVNLLKKKYKSEQ